MRPAPLLLLALALACGGDPGDDSDAASHATGDATDAPATSTTDAATTSAPTTGGATGEPTTGDGVFESLDERPCPEDSALTAENFGGPFMLTHCTGCHHSSLGEDERAGAPVGVDFNALADVRKHADRIWARAADQNMTMPPLGGPPQDERTRLGEWLACGAPAAGDL